MSQPKPDAVIVTVLRSGGEFRPAHADELHMQVAAENPELDLVHVCLTNYEHHEFVHCNRIPLEHGYRKRWCVYEAFDAQRILYDHDLQPLPISTPFVYMDVDTVCVGSILPLLSELMRQPEHKLVCLPDIYKPERAEMGIMCWRRPTVARAVSQRFASAVHDDPRLVSPDASDQAGRWLRQKADDLIVTFDRWQAGVWSYKADIRDARVTPGGKPSIVVFHGQPRPWHVGGAFGVRRALRDQEKADAS